MKLSLFFKTLLIAVASFALAYFFYSASTYKIVDIFSSDVATAEQAQLSFDGITNVQLETNASDVALKQGKSANTKLIMTVNFHDPVLASQKNLDITKDDKTLMIKFTPEVNADIALTLPDHVKSVSIKTLSGDITATLPDNANNKIIANSKSGDVTIKAIKLPANESAGTINLQSDSGDITVN